ncbi:hypothetical protein, partial [Nocardia sp. NPDC057455]|uniref:hypothetical protein n=1 Tax=Nocardia sp. NPDC057455 TaxID=3346138 RepID=UPI00366C90C4
ASAAATEAISVAQLRRGDLIVATDPHANRRVVENVTETVVLGAPRVVVSFADGGDTWDVESQDVPVRIAHRPAAYMVTPCPIGDPRWRYLGGLERSVVTTSNDLVDQFRADLLRADSDAEICVYALIRIGGPR